MHFSIDNISSNITGNLTLSSLTYGNGEYQYQASSINGVYNFPSLALIDTRFFSLEKIILGLLL
jgi:hypothetical protein